MLGSFPRPPLRAHTRDPNGHSQVSSARGAPHLPINLLELLCLLELKASDCPLVMWEVSLVIPSSQNYDTLQSQGLPDVVALLCGQFTYFPR